MENTTLATVAMVIDKERSMKLMDTGLINLHPTSIAFDFALVGSTAICNCNFTSRH